MIDADNAAASGGAIAGNRARLYRTEPSCVLAVASSIEQLVSRRGAHSLSRHET
jgi:hypothetical protein